MSRVRVPLLTLLKKARIARFGPSSHLRMIGLFPSGALDWRGVARGLVLVADRLRRDQFHARRRCDQHDVERHESRVATIDMGHRRAADRVDRPCGCRGRRRRAAGLSLGGALQRIRYAGAAYLVFLGIRLILTKPAVVVDDVPVPVDSRESHWSMIRRGFWVNLLNPKAIVFFLAFIPQFVRLDEPHCPSTSPSSSP